MHPDTQVCYVDGKVGLGVIATALLGALVDRMLVWPGRRRYAWGMARCRDERMSGDRVT